MLVLTQDFAASLNSEKDSAHLMPYSGVVVVVWFAILTDYI
jgi:hypothetical protein